MANEEDRRSPRDGEAASAIRGKGKSRKPLIAVKKEPAEEAIAAAAAANTSGADASSPGIISTVASTAVEPAREEGSGSIPLGGFRRASAAFGAGLSSTPTQDLSELGGANPVFALNDAATPLPMDTSPHPPGLAESPAHGLVEKTFAGEKIHPLLLSGLRAAAEKLFHSMQSEHKAEKRKNTLIKDIQTLESGKIPSSCKAHIVPFVPKEWTDSPTWTNSKTTSAINGGGSVTL